MQCDAATRKAIRHEGVWVELERCKDCRAHAYCTSHQEEKYDRYHKLLQAALRGRCPLEVNPGPLAAGVRLRQVKYNPILFQAQRPRCAKEDCDCPVETLRYPRLGAFEVYVCYGARRQEVFSKLKSQRWPKMDTVMERVEEVAESFGGWSGEEDADMLLPLPPPAPAPQASAPAPAPAAAKAKAKAKTKAKAKAHAPAPVLETASATELATTESPSSKSPLGKRYSGVGGKQVFTHAELCQLIKAEYQTVINAWRSFDRNNDGSLLRDEFDEGLRMCGVDLPPELLAELWKLADVDGNGTVNYQEFAQQLCGVKGGSSPSMQRGSGFQGMHRWTVSDEEFNKDKCESRTLSLAALARDPRIHQVRLEDLTIDLFRARMICKYGTLMTAFRLSDVNHDSEVSYDEWLRLLPKIIGDDVAVDVCNLLWHQLDTDRSGVVSFAEFFTDKLVDPDPEMALRQLESCGQLEPSSSSRPTSPARSARPKSPASSAGLASPSSGQRVQPTSLVNAAGPNSPGSAGARPKSAARARPPSPAGSGAHPKSGADARPNSKPSSPASGSAQLVTAAAESDARTKLVGSQKPPLPQEIISEGNIGYATMDKKPSVSNVSTAASSTDLRAELREGVQRPLSTTSSDMSMLSHVAPMGLSRPTSEGLLTTDLEVQPDIQDKDEYSECFEASLSHSAVAGMQTPAGARAGAAATALSPGSPAPDALLGRTTASLLPADDDRGEYSLEFEASASAGALAGMTAGAPPAAPAAPETASVEKSREALAAAVGIAGPGSAVHEQEDFQPILDRSEYSGFEASDLGLSAVAAKRAEALPEPAASPATASAAKPIGTAGGVELQAVAPAGAGADRHGTVSKTSQPLDMDDYSYGFEASASGGGSLGIQMDNADRMPAVAVLGREPEENDAEKPAAGIAGGGAPQPHVNVEALAETYSDFEESKEW